LKLGKPLKVQIPAPYATKNGEICVGCLCAKDYFDNTNPAVEQSPGKRYCLIGILKNYDWNKGMLFKQGLHEYLTQSAKA
tara:strand:+ start:285 stop:524 length:240 start_codon:yes stop_codon:yes gene_type:complete